MEREEEERKKKKKKKKRWRSRERDYANDIVHRERERKDEWRCTL